MYHISHPLYVGFFGFFFLSFFFAGLRGTGISKVKAHIAHVLIIVCSNIVVLFVFDVKFERRN